MRNLKLPSTLPQVFTRSLENKKVMLDSFILQWVTKCSNSNSHSDYFVFLLLRAAKSIDVFLIIVLANSPLDIENCQMEFSSLNNLNPTSDQDRNSPYNINTISSRQVMITKKNIQLRDYRLIQYQILRAKIIRVVWKSLRRITIKILAIKELRMLKMLWEVLNGITLTQGYSLDTSCVPFKKN